MALCAYPGLEETLTLTQTQQPTFTLIEIDSHTQTSTSTSASVHNHSSLFTTYHSISSPALAYVTESEWYTTIQEKKIVCKTATTPRQQFPKMWKLVTKYTTNWIVDKYEVPCKHKNFADFKKKVLAHIITHRTEKLRTQFPHLAAVFPPNTEHHNCIKFYDKVDFEMHAEQY